MKDTVTHIYEKEFDWSKRYGSLEQGDYRFVLSSTEETSQISIVVEFIISEDGKVSYSEPTIDS